MDLDTTALGMQGSVRRIFKAAPASQRLQDALRGSWLGHPLHPVLTDAVTAGMTMAVVFDALEVAGARTFRPAADASLAFAFAWTFPTALAGAADWQFAGERARRIGMFHMAANAVSSVCTVISLNSRMRGRRRSGRMWALAAFGTLNVGAYLGGELVYDEGMRVAHRTLSAEG